MLKVAIQDGDKDAVLNAVSDFEQQADDQLQAQLLRSASEQVPDATDPGSLPKQR